MNSIEQVHKTNKLKVGLIYVRNETRMANEAYKFRIYPDDVQKVLFARTFGCVRMVYNHWLARKIRQYEEDKTAVTYTVCAKEMAEMKKTEAYAFLREVDSVALQQSLRHLDQLYLR